MAMVRRGVVGSLKLAYQLAADVHDWTVTRIGTEWTLAGRVSNVHDYRASQHPLVFVAPHQDGSWRWPIVSLQIAGSALSAQLGPPEK